MIENSKPSVHIGRPPDKHVTKPSVGNGRPTGILKRGSSPNSLSARPAGRKVRGT